MITVRLPLALQLGTRPTIVVAEPVRTLGDLVEVLETHGHEVVNPANRGAGVGQ